MAGIIFEGIGLGLVLAALLGPVFFALIQTSLKQGMAKAIFMAIGISLSDAAYILLTYTSIAQFSENPDFIKIMGLGGGMLLVITGIYTLIKKPSKATDALPDLKLTTKDRLRFFLKGFTLNFINPAVFIFWVGSVGVVSLQLDYKNTDVAVFFLCTVLTVFFTDLVKIYVANYLSKIVNDKVLAWLNKISAVLMIAFGLKLIIDRCF